MDSEVDLSELDDWLGTLEELQLGLEKSKTGDTTAQSTDDNSAVGRASSPFSHVNQAFLREPLSPRRHVPPPPWELNTQFNHFGMMGLCGPVPLPSMNPPLTMEQRQKSTSSCCVRASHQSSKIASRPISPKGLSNGSEQLDRSFSGRNIKEATAERDLSCLLRDLELVEQKMKELEQGGNTFTRRYSLASSPSVEQPTIATHSHNLQRHCTPGDNGCANASKPIGGHGYISAQWAAEVNRDRPAISPPLTKSISPTLPLLPPSASPCALTAQPLPPAYLAAGDACVNTPNSSPPITSSTTPQSSPDTGLWFMNNDLAPCFCGSAAPTNGVGKGAHSNQTVHRSDFMTRTLTGGQPHYSRQPVANAIKPFGAKSTNSIPETQCGGSSQHYRDYCCSHLASSAELRTQLASSTIKAPCRVFSEKTSCEPDESSHGPHPVVMVNAASHGQSNSLVPKDIDEDSSLSEFSSCSRGNASVVYDTNKVQSFAPKNSHLSNSFTPESSLSDSSLPENPPCIQSTRSPLGSMDASLVKKLVIRIFRPDRTTKAIAIEEHMTAGEIASMLIEKNFLKPSSSLAVVEKVPALKVERVFEEHERVADCVSSWPPGSQNMIFFEERRDLFGFIEAPGLWFGEEFAELHRYNSADAVQLMLSNIEQTGFPEWKDYLYIRKPGEKTWSRRLCVLRSSGIYTSKKNKRSLSSTDLIRILVFDEKLQLYTTTGGWTRLRAPTPHGFAFKPYSAQDPTSTNVFCFCATDDKALRHWTCRLRIAKHGRQLYVNYQSALQRIQRLLASRHTPTSGLNKLNGSLSACVQRKSSFEITSSTSTAFSAPERSGSLSLRTGSPAMERQNQSKQTNYSNHPPTVFPKMDLSISTHHSKHYTETDRPVSPLLPRTQHQRMQISFGGNT